MLKNNDYIFHAIDHEVVPMSTCDRLLRGLEGLTHDDIFDSKWLQPVYLASDRNRLIDQETIYKALNIWCLYYNDMFGESEWIPKAYIETFSNIIELLRTLEKAGDALRHQEPDWYMPLGMVITNKVLAADMGRIFIWLNMLRRVLLRGLNTSDLQYRDFMFNEHRLSLIDEDSPSFQMVTDALSSIINKLLKGVKPDEDIFKLPPHQYLENTKYHAGKDTEPYDIFGKVSTLARYCSLDSDLPIDVFAAMGYSINRTAEVPNYNLFMVVPKNYKTGRSVCIESVYNCFKAYQLSLPLARKVNKPKGYYTIDLTGFDFPASEFDLAHSMVDFDPETNALKMPFGGCFYNDQVVNQVYAWLGSAGVIDITTTDLSKASDSYSVKVAKRVLSELLFNYAWKYTSRNTVYRNRKGEERFISNSNVMFTMGNPLTYGFMSVLLLACLHLAANIFEGLPLDTVSYAGDRKYFSAIGDDMIGSTKYDEVLKWVLTVIGFIYNDEKTHGGLEYPRFRESCGKEFLAGKPVTPLYYPRGTSNDELAELIGLQHKFWDCPKTNAFIINYCVSHFGNKFTVSEPGSLYYDFWIREAVPMEMKVKFYTDTPDGWDKKFIPEIIDYWWSKYILDHTTYPVTDARIVIEKGNSVLPIPVMDWDGKPTPRTSVASAVITALSYIWQCDVMVLPFDTIYSLLHESVRGEITWYEPSALSIKGSSAREKVRTWSRWFRGEPSSAVDYHTEVMEITLPKEFHLTPKASYPDTPLYYRTQVELIAYQLWLARHAKDHIETHEYLYLEDILREHENIRNQICGGTTLEWVIEDYPF